MEVGVERFYHCFVGCKCLFHKNEVFFVFRELKPCCAFLEQYLILLNMWDRSGMKAPSCCARPKNDRKSEVLLGLGKSVTALYLSSFGLMP